MKSISSQLEKQTKENEDLMKIKHEQDILHEQLKDKENKLKEANIELNKTKAENKVLLKHDQVNSLISFCVATCEKRKPSHWLNNFQQPM